MSELSVVEVQRLEALESVIDAGMQTFVHVGNALLEIRDNRLYRNTHRTFEEYCRERWEFSKSHASRLISAAEVVEVLKMSPRGDILPAVEKHARPLTSLPPEQQPAVWQRAVETAPNGKITQAHVQAVVDKHREEERTSSDEYCDEEDDQDSDYVYQGGLARCKYCWKIHDKWEPSADTPPSVRWVCEYCDHATADANMDLRQPEPDDNAAATHTPDVDNEHRTKTQKSHDKSSSRLQWTDDELKRQAMVESGITVHANMKTDLMLIQWAKDNGLFERIDRATDWGNPFVLPIDGDRQTVIRNYRIYLEMKPSLLSKLHTLTGKVLGCWCYPEECHAQVLQEYLLTHGN
jgi:hypothetical protein